MVEINYGKHYHNYDASLLHEVQMANEKKVSVFPYVFVGVNSNEEIEEKDRFDACLPAELGVAKSMYDKKFVVSKPTLIEYAKKKGKVFWNVFVDSKKGKEELTFCDLDYNNRVSSIIDNIYYDVLQTLKEKGIELYKPTGFELDLEKMHYEIERADVSLEYLNQKDLNQDIYFLTKSCCFVYSVYEIQIDISVGIKGTIMLECCVGEAPYSRKEKTFNPFTRELGDEPFYVRDSCRSPEIAKMILLEWLLKVYDFKENEREGLEKNTISVLSTRESCFKKFNATNEAVSKFYEFFLDYSMYRDVEDFNFEITVRHTVEKEDSKFLNIGGLAVIDIRVRGKSLSFKELSILIEYNIETGVCGLIYNNDYSTKRRFDNIPFVLYEIRDKLDE